MRIISFAMSMSLDGYIEGPNGDLSWSNIDEELHQHFNDLERQASTLLYGRGLYEIMSAYWPTAADNPASSPVEVEYAHIWHSKPKIVFSTTLKEAPWAERIVRENVEEEVRRLKQEPGGTMNAGGAGLASSLSRMGLIDEYSMYIHPVILGSGKRAFGPLEQKIDLELVETHRFNNGVTMLRYRRR